MSDLLNAIGSLFTFLIDGLSDIAEFFTTTTLGQLILGIALFSIVGGFVISIIHRLR